MAARTKTPQVTSYTRAPKKGTPAYDLWLMQRNATFHALTDEFDRWCRVMYAVGELDELPEPEKALYIGGGKFDRRFKRHMLFVELDGISYRSDEPMGHQTAKGYERDRRKDAAAIAAGWRVMRLTGSMLADGSGYAWLEHALGIRRKAGAA